VYSGGSRHHVIRHSVVNANAEHTVRILLETKRKPAESRMEDFVLTSCPKCGTTIQIFKRDINCRIFRCGIFKASNQPIAPHAAKAQIDAWLAQGRLHGCGQPFRLNAKNSAEVCDYI
jgi:hypothetical protein